MKHRWLQTVILGGLLLFGVRSVSAAEPMQEFVEGLRERHYYDYALLYLEQMESKPNLPEESRVRIPFEKALTLLGSSARVLNPDAQEQQLDQAQAYLEQFVEANPDHPLAARANAERARIFLGKARVEILKSKSPNNQNQKPQHQQQARELIARAREIFQTAHDQYEAAWKGFGVFIDQQKEKEKFEQRAQAEVNFIRAQLDLALCTYEESQTYDAGDKNYTDTLTNASNEFEEIHSKYRSQVGGLYARMWQGKCFEEQGELGRAMGIYNELLQHPGRSAAMQRLQDQVLQFRLITLNHEEKQDYQLVLEEASQWLNVNRTRARTERGLGIRWERARAAEQMGSNRTLPESDRQRYLRQALTDARTINRYPSQFKDVSSFMIRRLQVLLHGDAQDPADFETAYGLGRNMVKEIKNFNEKKAEATNDQERAEAQQDLENHLEETSRILRLALQLVDEEIELKFVNQARYLLSYVYYLMGRSYESAVLGEYVGRRFHAEDPQTAQDAAYMAMAAYVQAYNASDEGQKEIDMELMARACNLITEHWPDSDRANDARMTLGRIYGQLKQPVEAADWYSQVPENAPQYAAAQLAAGQAFWTAYLEAAPLPEDQKPPLEELHRWQDSAEQHLRTGIDKLQSQMSSEGRPSAELVAAKVSLGQIYINKGQYEPTVTLLTEGENSVIAMVDVELGEERPKSGIQSKEFAGLVFQLLLRSYVGTQKIDEALSAMDSLERISDSASTHLYTMLGQELEKELRRLEGLGEVERLAEVRQSFESFLNELFQRTDGQTYGSLIWIAETYYSLGQGISDQTGAATYFEKAASTYQEIINRAAAEAEFVQAGQLSGVQLRLVNCKRRQGDFEGAYALAKSILQERPNALDAQFEAAHVLQDWAASGQPDSWQKFLTAIRGDSQDPNVPVWGWAQTSLRLQRYIDSGTATSDFEERYLEASYNLYWCRYQYGLAQSSTPKRNQELESAKQEILTFAAVSGEIDDEWWTKFDTLFRDVQSELGQVPVALERPEPITIAETSRPTENAADEGTESTASTTETEQQSVAVPPSSGPSIVMVALTVILGLAVTGGMFVMMSRPNKRRKALYASAMPETAEAPKRRARPGASSGERKAAAPEGTSRAAKSAGTKPPAAKPGTSKTGKPRPPKPAGPST